MSETICFGGTPGYVDPRTPQERIVYELKRKLADAAAGKIEAFWSIDIQRMDNGDPVPTITAIIEALAFEEQGDAIREHMWGIADILREIYKK